MLNLLSLIFLSFSSQAEFDWTFQSYGLYENQKYVSFGGEHVYLLDNRLELKWTTDESKVIVRPRRWEAERESDTDLTQAFWEQNWSEDFSTTLGLQVYQWGPAEVMNVSNPFFHFNTNQRTLTYLEKGKVLLRANLNKGQHNWVFIAEPVSNNEAHWMTDQEFKPQAAIKYERTWADSRDNVGLVFGKSDDAIGFFGEYFELEFRDGWTLIGDARHSYKKIDIEDDWSSLALLGVRYEGDYDIRLEFIHHSAGYSKEEFAQVLVMPSLARTGLEFLQRNYVYLSIRRSGAFDVEDLNLYLRNFHSLDDKSGFIQFEFDKSLTNNLVSLASVSKSYGPLNSEFRLLIDERFVLGIKLVF